MIPRVPQNPLLGKQPRGTRGPRGSTLFGRKPDKHSLNGFWVPWRSSSFSEALVQETMLALTEP